MNLNYYFIAIFFLLISIIFVAVFIAKEPAKGRRSAGEAAENNRVGRKILDRAMKV